MSEEPAGEGSVGVTDYELVALVDMNPTPEGRRALEAIGVAGLLDDETAVRSGYASLLVRDVAGLDGSRVVAQAFGAALGTILTSADDILRLVLTKDGSVFGRTVLVDAVLGGVLLDMTAFGVHSAQPLHLDTDLVGLVHDIVADLAAGQGPDLPFDVEVTRFPLEGEPRAAYLTLDEPRLWRLEGVDPLDDRNAWAVVRRVLGPSDSEAAVNARRGFGPDAS